MTDPFAILRDELVSAAAAREQVAAPAPRRWWERLAGRLGWRSHPLAIVLGMLVVSGSATAGVIALTSSSSQPLAGKVPGTVEPASLAGYQLHDLRHPESRRRRGVLEHVDLVQQGRPVRVRRGWRIAVRDALEPAVRRGRRERRVDPATRRHGRLRDDGARRRRRTRRRSHDPDVQLARSAGRRPGRRVVPPSGLPQPRPGVAARPADPLSRDLPPARATVRSRFTRSRSSRSIATGT